MTEIEKLRKLMNEVEAKIAGLIPPEFHTVILIQSSDGQHMSVASNCEKCEACEVYHNGAAGFCGAVTLFDFEDEDERIIN